MWIVEPKIPFGLWWALVVATVLVVGWYATRRDWHVSVRQRIVLTLLLGLGLLGPLAIALNPTWVETIPPLPGNPQLSVLVDGTLSMRTADVVDQTTVSRWQRGVQLAEQVDGTGTPVEVLHYAFNEHLQPLPNKAGKLAARASSQSPVIHEISLTAAEAAADRGESEVWPNGHRSDLATVLRESTRSSSPLGHAVLLISDGAHNVGSADALYQAAREANALATPIYTVTLGTAVGMKNMSVTAKAARMIAFPNSPVAIRVTLSHSGLAGQQTQVVLLRDDKELQSRTVRLTSDPIQELRFTLPEGVQTPLERFRIVASEVAEEVTAADNQTAVLVQRLTAPIGVLLLEGKPYWDSKFLGRNLSRDPVVELTSIVKLGQGRYLQRKIQPAPLSNSATAGEEESAENKFTASADNQSEASAEVASEDWNIAKELSSPLESASLLEGYRVVVLGRDADVFLTPAAIDNLRSWISKSGGCLLCARGAPMDQVANKLAEVLPVRWSTATESRFRTQLSGSGIDSAIFDPLLSDDGGDPLASLPSLSTGSMPKARPGLPQVLVQSSNGEGVDNSIPVVTYQSYGRGQTIVVEGAGMWRWAFLPPQHADKDKIYPTLWQSLVQWIVSQQDIMPGQMLAVRTDRANFLSGQNATASVVIKDDKTPAQIADLAALVQSSEQELPSRLALIPNANEPGTYRVDMGTLDVGYYSLKIVSGERDEVQAATAFEVRDPWFESLEVDARPDVLRQVARLSGGEVLEPDQVKTLVQRFADKLKREQRHEETRTALWDRPLVLLLILGGWVTTWVIRRQSGLT